MSSIRSVGPHDAEGICGIYNRHVRDTIITFEEVEVAIPEMHGRIAGVMTDNLPWLVAEEEPTVLGYAYAAKFRDRSGYRFAAETTVYVAEGAQGQGIGTALYRALLARLKETPIRTALGVIALPNPASVALHEKCGFQKVGHLKGVGFKFGAWIDVGYWQIAWPAQ